MKYYAVTDDPRELYHYGVKGMKWGQHLFGEDLKPKSAGYKNAAKKLKSIMGKTVSGIRTAGKVAQKTAAQAAYNVRAAQDRRYQKAVQKAQKRVNLTSTLSSLDKEDKDRKRLERDQKMEQLTQKQADARADHDLKTLKTAVRAEKHMDKYYQQARTGMLKYGKLSTDQIERLQDRLALENNTRRLGAQEEPSWSQQKKMARRQGYLQGITKGTSAAMEEVARAGVQYGIQGLANKRKLDTASKQKAEREKEATRIKNKKTHSEMREDLKDQAYETQLRAGVHSIQRGAVSARQAARQLNFAENKIRKRQDKIEDDAAERKFLRDEKQNKRRFEREEEQNAQKFLREENQNEQKANREDAHKAKLEERKKQERLAEANADADDIGKSLYERGFAIVPAYTKEGKQTGVKVITADGSNPQKNKNGAISSPDDGPAYLRLYQSKYKLKDNEFTNKIKGLDLSESDQKAIAQAEKERRKQAKLAKQAEQARQAELAKKAEEERIKQAEMEEKNRPRFLRHLPLGMTEEEHRARDAALRESAEERRMERIRKEREEHAANVDRANAAHILAEQRRNLPRELRNDVPKLSDETREQAVQALIMEEQKRQRQEAENQKRFEQYQNARKATEVHKRAEEREKRNSNTPRISNGSTLNEAQRALQEQQQRVENADRSVRAIQQAIINQQNGSGQNRPRKPKRKK